MARKLTVAERRKLREEAAEWDRLSDAEVADLFDSGEPVRLRIRRPPPRVVPVALDERVFGSLTRIARHKQVGPRDLAAMWIAERLAQEERRRGRA